MCSTSENDVGNMPTCVLAYKTLCIPALKEHQASCRQLYGREVVRMPRDTRYGNFRSHLPLRVKLIINSHGGVVESKLGPLGTSATSGLLYLPWVTVRMENLWNENWQGKPKYSEKTCPSATVSTANLT
jgi:hypothetical protein